MPRLGIVNEHFNRSFEETCTLLADIGFDGVAITPWTVTDSMPNPPSATIDGIRTAAGNAGLEVLGIPRIFSASDTDYHIGHPDAAVRAKTLDYLRETVRFCGALGGEVVVFGAPNQRSVGPEYDDDATWNRAISTIGDEALLTELATTGVTLCMEPLSTEYTDFITTAAEAVAFVAAIDHPNVKIVLDAFHLANEAAPPAAIIEQTAPYLAHFHADNTEGLGPGVGRIDFAAIAAALNGIGYDGYVSIELHADVLGEGIDGSPADIAAESRAFLDRVFS